MEDREPTYYVNRAREEALVEARARYRETAYERGRAEGVREERDECRRVALETRSPCVSVLRQMGWGDAQAAIAAAISARGTQPPKGEGKGGA